MNFDNDSPQLVATFSLGNGSYGISAEAVSEVIALEELTPVPHASPCVLGILNVRGSIVTAIDTKQVLGLPPTQDADREGSRGAGEGSAERRLILLDAAGERVAFLVDSLEGSALLGKDSLAPLPPNTPLAQQRIGIGVLRSDELVAMILNPKLLVQQSLEFPTQ